MMDLPLLIKRIKRIQQMLISRKDKNVIKTIISMTLKHLPGCPLCSLEFMEYEISSMLQTAMLVVDLEDYDTTWIIVDTLLSDMRKSLLGEKLMQQRIEKWTQGMDEAKDVGSMGQLPMGIVWLIGTLL